MPKLLNRLLGIMSPLDFKTFLWSMLAALMLLGGSVDLNPAYATTGYSTVFAGDPGIPNIYPECDADATTGQTYATTSYADVTLASCAFVPHRNDPTGAALQAAILSTSTTGYADQIWVSYSVDATKATSTTGTCAVYANGAIVALTARTLGVGEDSINWEGFIPNTTVGSQTVKLQCKSGDTATLTVNFAHLIVWDVMRFPLTN